MATTGRNELLPMLRRIRHSDPLSLLGYTPPAGGLSALAAAPRLLGFGRTWRSADLKGILPVQRVALSRPPLSALARRAATIDDFLDGRSSRPSLLEAGDLEPVAPHPGAYADLFDLGNHPPPPWTVSGGAYQGFGISGLRMTDVVLVPECGVVMPKPGLISTESHQQWRQAHRRIPGLIDFDGPAPRLDLAEAAPRSGLAGPHLSICHPYARVYAHWISDCLAGISGFIEAIRARRVRLAAPPLAQWQLRTLAMLGIERGMVTEIGSPAVLCEDLSWTSGATSLHTHQPSARIREIYARLSAAVPDAAGGAAPRLVQISRSLLAEDSHRCLNEDELSAALARLGFIALHPERMTIEAQVAAFARAEAIVGLHGSGFANIGFAPAGCLVVDCAAPPQVVPWLFRLTRQLEQRYVLVICEEPYGSPWRATTGTDPGGPPGSFRIDVERTVKTVRSAMRRAGIRPAEA